MVYIVAGHSKMACFMRDAINARLNIAVSWLGSVQALDCKVTIQKVYYSEACGDAVYRLLSKHGIPIADNGDYRYDYSQVASLPRVLPDCDYSLSDIDSDLASECDSVDSWLR